MAISAHYANGAKERERRSLRPYPWFTVDEAAAVALAIYRLNGGHPWPPADVARALDMGARTPRFYYLTAAARDYGFTLGTRDANRIELTDLGRRLSMAVDSETRRQIKREAFLRVDVFRRVLRHYNGENLPDIRFLGNTLTTEFGIAPEHHREFVDLFTRNYVSTFDKGRLSEVAVTQTPQGTFSEPSESRSTESALADVEQTVDIVRPEYRRTQPMAAGMALVIAPAIEGGFPAGFFKEVANGLLLPAVRNAFGDATDIGESWPYSDEFIDAIQQAALVIADVTVPDPHVALAVGLRLGAGRPIVFARASGTTAPDLPHRVFEYNRNLWPSTLRDDLVSLTDTIASAL
jgi:hypothetical protein